MAYEDDDLTRQIDELSAMAAIYADEWCVVDEVNRIYCISVSEGKWKITLQVLLPENYPSESAPEFQIYENKGECTLHLLVEKVREHLQMKKEEQEDSDISTLEKWSAFDTASNSSKEDDLILVSNREEDIEIPEILHGEPFTDRKSTFQGHIAFPVTCVQQVKSVVRKLYENRKIANATHNIMAYRIEVPSTGAFLQDCDDDGETAAGGRVLHLLQMVDARNVVVIVSRWFGGILLHLDRFKHISNAARNMLELTGFIEIKEDSKKKKKVTKSKGK
ncbi:Protein IMPACT-B [Holothuria leucospilota]|uniref:Protein IMPACT-B n=1 Tax=Holothuria leucospilota TaxID=206669 RepID=A0A9Q1CBS3_HOLLE|nr:Protein IMPACT-B [Holothuria leucospilota]